MLVTVLAVVLGFQIKHFVADYLLQFDWMVAEKGDLRKFGGYAHAGLHVVGSLMVLLLASVHIVTILWLIGAEFVIHYTLDFTKIYYSKDVNLEESPQKYFALHGFDQFLHHATYIVMSFVALSSLAV